MRPCTQRTHTAPNDVLSLRYDNKILFGALKSLLAAEKANTDGYIFDVCDITRQVLSNRCAELFEDAMKGFNTRDVRIFERSSNAFLKICDEVDELLQTRPELTLADHLREASELALSDKEKENFELNLLVQITVWGPPVRSVNYDYAWKEWGGLIKTFYAKRWQSFFEFLAIRFPKRGKYSSLTKKQYCERNLYQGNQFYKSFAEFERKWLSTVDPEKPTDVDTVQIARTLAEKYEKAITE